LRKRPARPQQGVTLIFWWALKKGRTSRTRLGASLAEEIFDSLPKIRVNKCKLLPWCIAALTKIERQQKVGKEVVFRADAAFAKPEIYEALEERGVKYAIRIAANDTLEMDIAELLTRRVGRPSHRPVVWYKSFLYQAASWKTARRVVAKVEFHLGELCPRLGFIVTNLETDRRAVVRFYFKRGTSEQWIKEGKHAVKMTRLSCHPASRDRTKYGCG
jgi:hypothetical protein